MGGDGIVRVYFVPVVTGTEIGRAVWDENGLRVYLLEDVPYADAVLAHELWHLWTRNDEHLNLEPCVSKPARLAPLPDRPCDDEREQVLSSGRVLRVSFPEAPDVAVRAVEWWNVGCGEVVGEVVD